jgi:tetratricopeptide (TPR) repeat protein
MNAERYTDAEVVGYCTQQLEACAVQDGLSGPKSALPATLGLIATIERLASGASAQIRGELLKVGARAAEFCGWLYRDAGAAEIASYWRDRAVELAQMSGDYAMQGYVLLKKSQAVWDERDGLRMLTLAEAVQQGPWKLPVRVQAEAVQQQARGVALLGGSLALIESKLAEAHEMLTQGLTLSADQSRGDASHYTNALFGIQAAICYCEAGQLETSLELYENWLSPGTFSRRDYAYFLALKGGVLARMEHAEDAAEIGLEAFTLARETESVRTVKELARMASRLGGYADRAGVHELRMLVLTS